MKRLAQILRSRLLSGRSTFQRGFVSTFVLDAAGKGLGAVAVVLLVRSLSVESFTYVVLFLNVGQLAGTVAMEGILMRYVREEAERVSRGLEEPSSFFITLVGTAAMIASVAALALLAATVLGIGGSAAERITFLGLAALYTLGHAGTQLGMYHHQAHFAFGKAGVLGLMRYGVSFVVALGAAVGLLGSGPVVALWLALGTLVVGATVCAPLAWAARGLARGADGRLGLGSEAGWLTLYSLVSSGFWYTTLFLVAALLDDEAVASYGAAQRYALIVLGPVPALLAVLRVRTAQHDLVDSRSAQMRMLLRWLRRTSVPMLAILGTLAALAPLVIPLIDGGRYPLSVTIFQLLMIGAFSMYATMPAANLLITQRRYRLLAVVFSAFLVAQATASIIAGTVWGVLGMAIVDVTFTTGARVTLVSIVLWPHARATRRGGPAEKVGSKG